MAERYKTANALLNQVAAECGIAPRNDPFAGGDDALQQMRHILQMAGEEMVSLHPWQQLVNSHQFTTQNTDTGDYPMPEDFDRWIDQTGWEESNRIPLQGPLSAQEWTYVMGRKLAQHTIYISFRENRNVLSIYPRDPVPEGGDINFEYVSRFWVSNDYPPATVGAFPGTSDTIESGSDYVLFEPTAIRNYVSAKFLGSKGFDNTVQVTAFETYLQNAKTQNTSGRILNASNQRNQFPFLNPTNLPDTGYG